MADWRSCEHHSGIRKGRLVCLLCGAQYVIDVLGARWTPPRPHWRRKEAA